MSNNNRSEFQEQLENKDVIIDTSTLLLAGTALLSTLPKCSLVIPSIVVKELEEKRSSETLGYHARQWIHLLEEMRLFYGFGLRENSTVLNFEEITLRVEPNHSAQSILPKHLQDGSNDSTILAVLKNLYDEGINTVLLSNDMPMRLHATLDLEIDAVEFNSTLIRAAKPFDGKTVIDLTNDEYIDSTLVNPSGISIESMIKEFGNDAFNSWVQVSVEGNASYNFISGNDFYTVPRKVRASSIVSKNIEQDVALSYLLETVDSIPIVSLGGSAGTGKTLLSIAAALQGYHEGEYQKIVVLRSLHEMGKGQEMGFLPGDVNEKMEAWAGAVSDAIDVIASLGKKTQQSIIDERKRLRSFIEVSPITYLRGRSLSNCFVILDEAQNFSRSELLNIISRAGVGTKMVLCSDSNQVDNRFLQSGSKADIWSVINDLKGFREFAHVTLSRTERSRVAEIASSLLEA